jgi:PHP family Zn ribbon phosphoesterase
VLHVDSPSSQKVWGFYNSLIEKSGDEYTVLIDESKDALSAVAGQEIADAIVRVRNGQILVVPGFDGVYGRLVLTRNDDIATSSHGTVRQRHLTDFA